MNQYDLCKEGKDVVSMLGLNSFVVVFGFFPSGDNLYTFIQWLVIIYGDLYCV